MTFSPDANGGEQERISPPQWSCGLRTPVTSPVSIKQPSRLKFAATAAQAWTFHTLFLHRRVLDAGRSLRRACTDMSLLESDSVQRLAPTLNPSTQSRLVLHTDMSSSESASVQRLAPTKNSSTQSSSCATHQHVIVRFGLRPAPLQVVTREQLCALETLKF